MIELREPKFKLGDYVTDRLGFAGRVENILSYRFSDKNYIYDVSPLDENDNWREFAESRLTPYIKKPKSVWDLEKGDTYYVIDCSGDVSKSNWHGYWLNYDYETQSRKVGNAFLTEEEAKFERERRKIETEMLRLGGRRKFNRGKDNYFIMYTRIEGLDYVNYHSMHEQGVIYFDSELDAINAVKTIGKDKIKKYIFGVES